MTTASASLIGDYLFDHEAPLANSIKNGLPDLLFNEFHPEFPPLLTGQEIPKGGSGAAGNGWALGWTTHVPAIGFDRWTPSDCRIPDDPRLDLGDRFTLWMRIIYGGEGRGRGANPYQGGSYNLITLNGPDGEPMLAWTVTPDEEMALDIRLVDASGNAEVHTCTSASHNLLPKFSRWYDLALTFDKGKVTFAATEIGRTGPGSTNAQSFDLGQGLSPAKPSGAMYILKATNTALERLRIYRAQALTADEIAALSKGVRLPGPVKTRSVEVGTERHLFLDDAVIDDINRLDRVLHPAAKHPENPIIRRGQSPVDDLVLDNAGISVGGGVIVDEQEKLFKMWGKNTGHLYLTSTDGMNWDRPVLNILGPDNRISVPNYRGGKVGHMRVFKDAHEPDPRKRYKGFVQRDPYYYITSPDGLRWRQEGIAAHYTDDTPDAAYHPERREYVKIGRFCPDGRSLALRLIMTCVSSTELADGNSPWHLVMLPSDQDLADDPHTQYYFMPAYPYHDMYVGFLGLYHAEPTPTAGSIDLELTFSRDGLNWHRPGERNRFIERGAPGTWDSMWMGWPRMIRVRDQLWFYYAGNSGGHHHWTTQAIGLAKLRLDGFASLRAGHNEGTLLTTPFMLKGDGIEINARADGAVRLRLLHPDTGAELAVGEPFTGDSCHHNVAWRGTPRLADLVGTRVQIEFAMTDADLYAFQVTGP